MRGFLNGRANTEFPLWHLHTKVFFLCNIVKVTWNFFDWCFAFCGGGGVCGSAKQGRVIAAAAVDVVIVVVTVVIVATIVV